MEGLAAERGFVDVSDVWTAGVELAALRGEHGTLDQELVRAELGKLAQAKPHYLAPGPNLHQGARRPVEEPERPSFGAALRRTVRGG